MYVYPTVSELRFYGCCFILVLHKSLKTGMDRIMNNKLTINPFYSAIFSIVGGLIFMHKNVEILTYRPLSTPCI